MRKAFDYKSKKFFLICFGWVITAFVLIIGITKGFPKDQAGMIWDYFKIGWSPVFLALNGWYFKKDVDEKEILKN
ncbi:MAG: hypothetical protein ABEK36_04025 [Candidatus Aenigmatarchaeota archaeon]